MDDPNPQARADALSYKLRKEAFVSNLSGSSLTDINLVTLVVTSAILLWNVLVKRGLLQSSSRPVIYSIDFLLNVCAILFAFTAYASFPAFLNLALFVPAVLLLLPLGTNDRQNRRGTRSHNEGNTKAKSPPDLQKGSLIVRPFLTNYRGAMLASTAIAILAVDFHVFPRRFAKVETWGTSLMDLGVGSFVFSAGVVGARSVLRPTHAGSVTGPAAVMRRMVVALRHSLPLLVLGFIRLISVKNLEYAEHVTEYGVHWNFFFTLALLPPFVEVVDSSLAILGLSSLLGRSKSLSMRYDSVALIIAGCYEYLLNTTRLLPFIVAAPRTPSSDLITKNREGLFSFYGYLAIFLAGRSTGILLCQYHETTTGSLSKQSKTLTSNQLESQSISRERRKVILPQLLTRFGGFATLFLLSTSVYAFNLTVSRRLANLPYVIWIIAFNNAQLFLYALMEHLGPEFTFSNLDKKVASEEDLLHANQIASPIMQAFNKNGLAVFLVANLATGMVNMSMNTLDTPNAQAMGVLIGYTAFISSIAVALDWLGIKIKV